MSDISKKFKMIIDNEDLFRANPEVMLRLKYLVDNKKSFKNITKEEIEALYIYLNRHNIANS
jgi:hypothetical protein